MFWTMAELRGQTLHWLDDPRGEIFGTGGAGSRIDGLINVAYEKVVQVIDQSPYPWAVEREEDHEDFRTTEAREYQLDGWAFLGGRLRHVIDVHDVTNASTPIRLDIIPYEQRNTSDMAGVYVFRAPTGERSAFFIGIVQMPTPYEILRVQGARAVPALQTPYDEPDLVPVQFRQAITYGAAMLGKVQQGEDPSSLAGLYSMALADVAADTGKIGDRTHSTILPG